jgi:hypothetical protein
MSELSKKTKLALDESRMLILGAQILLGFQFRGALEKGFEALPHSSQLIKMISLGIQLITIILIMWPGSYHRIVRDGNDAPDVHEFTTRVMNVALLPFIIALGLEFFVMSGKVVVTRISIVISLFITGLAVFLWYGLEFLSRWLNWDHHLKVEKHQMEETKIYDKVEQALIEARVVLPGAQALLGFQFATMLLEGFDKLPASSKYCHLVSLALMALTVMLLMAPAAYHRIVERGEATEHFHRVATWLLLLAMIIFPLGICGDLYVVLQHVLDSTVPALSGAAAALILFYSLWFGFTLYRRRTVAG